ncbi:MAG: GHMP kinase [Ignisphaera sp.]|nr:GHMP kinase [Ignisphaera sp.]MCX8167791.1 GHMP kinase [Ignisphaera sp.]MDW8085222.1 galactokinase family protein [Ignisphaera sp.]
MEVSIVESIVERFRERYGREPSTVASAPGRLDFLNTHQDYKGLPVVAVGINLRTYIAIEGIEGKSCEVFSENIGLEDKFSIVDAKLVKGKWFGNYLRASIIALKNHGYNVTGFRAYIHSDIPIASGLGSSAALTVAFIMALNAEFDLKLSRRDIAELAFEAENQVMGIPCGRLDQYASSYGGVILINTKPPYSVSELDFGKGLFVVVDSGIRHSTADIHPNRQREIEEGLKKLLSMELPGHIRSRLGYRFWEPRWDELSEDELKPYLESIDRVSLNRILFTLRMHRSTMLAIEIMKGVKINVDEMSSAIEIDRESAEMILNVDDWDLRAIGTIMLYQHKLLSKLYDVSLPELDKIVERITDAGAYGAKLSGAGLGGAVIGLVKDFEIGRKALDRVVGSYAANGYMVNIDRGAVVH